MEFTDSLIARLVLGYLKNEKCKSAVNEFINHSPHFKNEVKSGKIKYMSTRVSGLSLTEYLHEYAQIYSVVQGRLEATAYFLEHYSKATLIEQLLYLLDKIHCSRSSTPSARTPDVYQSTPIELSSDVEATPAHSLPGNVEYQFDEYSRGTPWKRKESKLNKSESSNPGENNDQLEVFTKTLIESKEFTEKLAQTINIVRNTPEANKKSEEVIKAGATAELNAIIKTVVKSTEEDPIFERILDEIIGSTHLDNESNAKESKSNQNFLEEQNNEAIQSIIVASNTKESQTTETNNEVIVFDGSFDNFLKTSTQSPNIVASTAAHVQQNTILQNPGYLLFPNQQNVVKYDPTKQIYLLNTNQQLVNVKIPQIPQIKPVGSGLSEQEIMAMPTVIVNDDQNSNTSQKSIKLIQTQYQPMQINQPQPPTDDLHANLNEYIRLYKSEEGAPPAKKVRTLLPRRSKNKNAKTQPAPSTSNVVIGPPPTESVTVADKTAKVECAPSNPTEPEGVTETLVKSLPDMQSLDVSVVPEPEPEPIKTAEVKNVTPVQTMVVKKATPKSGSHVRNLNFTTPPKVTSTGKKKVQGKKDKSPTFIHKKQAAKSLFKSEDNKPPKKVIEKRDLKNEWDTQLRALAAINEEDKSATPKRKPKTSGAPKRKARKADSKLNATAQAAMLLEAALKTPIKKDVNAQVPEKQTEDKQDESAVKVEKVEIETKKCLNVKPAIKIETVEDPTVKTILSPSKLNANKRNLVKLNDVTTSTVPTALKVEDPGTLITPETSKLPVCYAMKANRNITPMLETPLKIDFIHKTPGLRTPVTGFTPFNKVLDDQLQGIDINSIETPNLPITPNFPPFTPSADLMTPYANRPTDYSGSSSYYQPSDNEQNRSIEHLLEEYNKPKKDEVSKTQIKILHDVVLKTNNVKESPPSMQEHVSIFNRNVIGKKNLNLVKKSMKQESSSDSSSSSSSEDEEEQGHPWTENTNQTIICKNNEPSPKPAPVRPYSLRTRSKSTAVETPEVPVETPCPPKKAPTKKDATMAEKTTEINIILNTVEQLTTLEKKSPIKILLAQEKILQELKAKRERVILKFKGNEPKPSESVVDKPKPKSRQRIKPQPNLKAAYARKNRRKPETPKKAVLRARSSSSEKNTSKNKSSDKSFTNDFLLTSDDEEEKPVKMETRSKKSQIANSKNKVSKIDKHETASDVEAEKLVTGLKQRGIHLMYNKTPKSNNQVCKTNKSSDVDKTIETLLKNETEKILKETKKEEKISKSADDKSKKSLVDKNDKSKKVLKTSPEDEKISTKVGKSSKNENTSPKFEKSTPKDVKTSIKEEKSLKDEKDERTPQKDIKTPPKNVKSPERIYRFLEEFSTATFEDDICFKFDESAPPLLKTYDLSVLRDMKAKVFFDDMDLDLPVKISVSPLEQILDIPSTVNVLIPKKFKELNKSRLDKKDVTDSVVSNDDEKNGKVTDEIAIDDLSKSSKIDDDLMNYALVGSGEPSTDDSNMSPKGSRKRKIKVQENLQVEKKSKTCENILKTLDVDIFLNKLHGQN
ncbi:unnamed protein product [Brassicogethes aeneus]|uniref:LisH domain-containing protein n=1 Tax=Brassicogethes aeneus TaxID=1431903 RepID=A0A9P0AYV6_BRAAE|nr:unnamed protein product [Brassicogethes aeneus]